MIVGEQKPINEIKEIVAPYKRLLILGCGTCVKTCFAGGEDEVATLASALRLMAKKEGREVKIEEQTVERQCEDEFIQEAAGKIADSDPEKTRLRQELALAKEEIDILKKAAAYFARELR